MFDLASEPITEAVAEDHEAGALLAGGGSLAVLEEFDARPEEKPGGESFVYTPPGPVFPTAQDRTIKRKG